MDEQEEGREMSESITKELRDCIFDCPHLKGAHEPPETLEDVRKSCDNTIAYLASVSGMGWHDVETFSKDVHKQLDHAYACGKRDGAGERA